MSDLVKQWREYVDSMGSVIGEVEEMADAMAARIEELEAENADLRKTVMGLRAQTTRLMEKINE